MYVTQRKELAASRHPLFPRRDRLRGNRPVLARLDLGSRLQCAEGWKKIKVFVSRDRHSPGISPTDPPKTLIIFRAAEIRDEGLMTQDIDDCLSVVIAALRTCDLPASEVIAWCSTMLENDRVGFIARKPMEALRTHWQKTVAG